MNNSLKTRLAVLEKARATVKKTAGVVTYGPNETQEQALERAKKEGVTGAVLLMPTPMTYEDWVSMMEKAAK